MRTKQHFKGFSTLLLLLFIASLGVFFYFVKEGRIDRNLFSNIPDPYCNIPIKISLGEIDPRFNLSHELIQKELETATLIWEDSMSKDLFIFEGKGKSQVIVNFVYDERQKSALESIAARSKLALEWREYEKRANEIKALDASYKSIKGAYESALSEYNSKLDAYESRVRNWNRNPGTPEEYESLKREGEAVNATFSKLETKRKELNRVADKINNSADSMKELYTRLSIQTDMFNTQFSSDEQITIGEYDGTHYINIYQYTGLEQLRVTLAHELGHALGMDHIENDESIMYPLQNNQGQDLILTNEDKSELMRVCRS